MTDANKNLVVATFRIRTKPDKRASAEAGRPIGKDQEVVEIRTAADRQTVRVFPAHDVWRWIDGPNGREAQTYAMRFEEQYKRWKAGHAQAMTGTPLEELTFLTQAKRYELKALSIFTAETLAALDGKPLANLGMGGRELKNQAQAYLDKAAENVGVLKLANENAELRARLEQLEQAMQSGEAPPPDISQSPFATWEVEDLKTWIAEATGARPKGNPSHATLVAQADKVNHDLAKAKAQEPVAA